MAILNCNCKSSCTTAALVISAILGVLTAFLQITGVITLPVAFLWVAFGIAAAALGILLATTVLRRTVETCSRLCTTLNTLLLGILGTILLALVLLAVGIIATSIISAILVGLLLFFLSLIFTGAACFIRCLSGCED